MSVTRTYNDEAELSEHLKACHIPLVKYSCTKCEYESNTESSLNEHVQLKHVNETSFKCEKCDLNVYNEADFRMHVMITHQAEVISNSLHKCPQCSLNIHIKDQKLQCDLCYFFFHKSCTDRKSKGGRAPKGWKCTSCLCITSKLNPGAPTFSIPQLTCSTSENSRPTLVTEDSGTTFKRPTLTGKHRKSNLCDHPNTELLEMQIDTLKTTLAKKELELTKVKQSDALKAKQINNLESKLQESLKTLNKSSETNFEFPESSISTINLTNESIKVQFLEDRTSSLEHQIGLLSAKLESVIINTSMSKNQYFPQNTSNPENVLVEKYLCDRCDYESKERNEMKVHKEQSHEKHFDCKKCDFTAKELNELKTHKSEQHPPIIHTCEFCDFNTVHFNQIDKHTKTNHSEDFMCDQCTFRAANKRDLTNHKNTKHAPVFPCNFCTYKSSTKTDLNRHIRGMHEEKQPTIQFRRTKISRVNVENVFRDTKPNNSYNNTRKEPFEKEIIDTIEELEIIQAAPEATVFTANISLQTKPLKCDRTCKTWQKTFDHQDEMDLHVMFYHESTAAQQ